MVTNSGEKLKTEFKTQIIQNEDAVTSSDLQVVPSRRYHAYTKIASEPCAATCSSFPLQWQIMVSR